MKTRSLILVAMALPLSLHAATIVLPGSPVIGNSPNPATSPTAAINVLGVATGQVDIANFGTTATGGSWSARAKGGTNVDLALNLGSVTLNTQTEITSSVINFNSTTTTGGLIGSLVGNAGILGQILGANLAPTWEASVNLTQLGLNLTPNTTYSLSFNLSQSTSLLGNLSPAVLNRFTVAVGDTGGFVGAQLLGLTDVVGANGKLSLNFTTDSVITGDVVARFGANALLDADLLGDLLGGSLLGTPNQTLYSISGFDVSAIPEPSSLAISGLLIGGLALRRRRA